jgi:hypothetical protein
MQVRQREQGHACFSVVDMLWLKLLWVRVGVVVGCSIE